MSQAAKRNERSGGKPEADPVYVRWFDDLGNTDVPVVGGKNASLGELTSALRPQGVRVPDGFAVTAEGYRRFLADNDLVEPVRKELAKIEADESALPSAGGEIRRRILEGVLPPVLEAAILGAYRELGRREGMEDPDVAVRSSATAEDLPGASFAGQQETYLNVRGENELLDACRRCFASLYTDRAISYRRQKGFSQVDIALSVGVQKMVRADLGVSGVMFSIDTETGFPHLVVINASYGLGENVVQGTVSPDEYRVFKPSLGDPSRRPILDKILGKKEITMVYAGDGRRVRNLRTKDADRRRFALSDGQILQLARWAVAIEDHYGCPMDMEWALDGRNGELHLLQARPETVASARVSSHLRTFKVESRGAVKLLEGLAIGESVAVGEVCRLKDISEADRFREGQILVTGVTDPDWVQVMKRAAGIITDHGGRTSHAAIVSRELGVPAVVGTETGSQLLRDGQLVTLSCAEGETGRVYEGRLACEVAELDLREVPRTRTAIMLNVASPEAAFRWWRLPCEGIGLARMEFVIGTLIRIHPMALVRFDELEESEEKATIARLTAGYEDRTGYFVDRLAGGIARIAASRYPDPVIVRLSDFKTNEYAGLLGGKRFEPDEENPMLGFRGASRYYSPDYRPGFELECRALLKVRREMGLTNVVVMVPFCRTLEEADRVIGVMGENGLVRGEDGLEVYVMAEIPSNVLLAGEFARRFDGFSIGSNDLTQLVLGVDRDSEKLSHLFDERNEAVKIMIRQLIAAAHDAGVKVGICGQAPSDHPGFAEFLVEAGIDSISLNPDSVIGVKKRIADLEARMRPDDTGRDRNL